MTRISILLCALLVAAQSALAAATWIAEPDPKTISWSGKEGNGASFEGQCSNFTANIAFDPGDLGSSAIEVTIDMASCRTGETNKDEYLPQEGWFNIAEHPKAVFAAKKFRHSTGNEYVADGELTLRGETVPVELPFTLDIDGEKAHVVGKVMLNRLDFGVGGGQLASPEVAAPEVTVKIDLRATKA
ncbi:MAG: YceI family protein [Parvibaculum sp.]|nr:YceI family protein [Parvibaculum sp.]